MLDALVIRWNLEPGLATTGGWSECKERRTAIAKVIPAGKLKKRLL
jgi:hypothetical protein